MPLNRGFIGRTVCSTDPMEVTRHDIRRFAAAIGDRNPAYRDVAAAQELGHRDLIAPPTFLITASAANDGVGAIVGDPELGLDYTLVVHGEQKFQFHRPIQAGDRLDSVTSITDIRVAGRNELILLVTEVSCQGDPVATVSNTIVSRGTAPPRPVAVTAPTVPTAQP